SSFGLVLGRRRVHAGGDGRLHQNDGVLRPPTDTHRAGTAGRAGGDGGLGGGNETRWRERVICAIVVCSVGSRLQIAPAGRLKTATNGASRNHFGEGGTV